ncbi:MAG: hypothetical protein RL326_136, partial [Pseudomonadota bacterium]
KSDAAQTLSYDEAEELTRSIERLELALR